MNAKNERIENIIKVLEEANGPLYATNIARALGSSSSGIGLSIKLNEDPRIAVLRKRSQPKPLVYWLEKKITGNYLEANGYERAE